MMKSKKRFEGPAIIQELHLDMQCPVLNASVATTSNIKSVGQEVKELNFDDSGSSFNFEWDSD